MPHALTEPDATRGVENGARTCNSDGVRVLLACWLAALFVLLAGCGGKSGPKDNGISKLTPNQALTTMKQAVADAKSVHIVGTGSSGGSKLALDLTLQKDKGGQGTVAFNGLSIQIVKIGDKLYFKGSAAFLKKYAGAAASLLAGRWFVVSSSTKGFSEFTPLTNIVKLTNSLLANHGPLSKGQPTTVAGQPALPITDTTSGGVLYIATTGPAYPLQLKPKKGTTGLVRFMDWDQPVTLTPPPNPVDLSKLTGG
jgi:hypothetical protein